MTAKSAEAPTPGPRSRAVEFLLTGGATLFLFPLSWLARRLLGLGDAEFAVGFLGFYAAFVINDPHFAVTYLLFYRKHAVRTYRWLFAGVVVPLLLCGWAIGALKLHSAPALGWMIQLMFFLVGWHYVKQGFGVLSVLSARRGVRVTPLDRKVVLFHCFAGWAFAWSNPSGPVIELEEKGVVYSGLAHPRWIELGTGGVLAASTIALVVTLATRHRREGRMLPLAPLLGLLVTVWAWTIFSSLDPLVRYVIPALHSVQYLYFVWLMKRNEACASEGPPSFGRPVAVRLGVLALSAIALGFFFFHGAPTFLDTAFVPRTPRGAVPDALGETPFFAAIFVIVNIHHYFMDHVIWRRENPDTRWLFSAIRP